MPCRHYLILDEAHYIKNFKSQRWQTLLTFSSRRRLLLTGTPLQNSLMELWSLMHFLMPHLFRSQAEFKYWFSNPLNQHVDGSSVVDQSLVGPPPLPPAWHEGMHVHIDAGARGRARAQQIRRLHAVLRPFVLRRLKKDVAKQMPGKFEHVLQCKLSKRQRCVCVRGWLRARGTA